MLMVNLVLWLVLYSAVGWIYETIYHSILEKRLVNRGFLNGPIIPIYGIGAVTVHYALNGIRGNLLFLFLAGAVLACTLEYLTAVLLETLFDMKWWDYSTYKFNLQGRICLLGAVVFGLFSLVMVEWVHPIVKVWTESIPAGWRIAFALFFVAAVGTDTVVTVIHILRMNGRLREIQEAFDRFSDYAAGRASGLRDSIVNGVRETTSDIRETTGVMRDSFMNNIREKTSGLRETTGEMRDALMNNVRVKAGGFREATGDMRDSFVNGMREKTSSLLVSADSLLESLLERFERSEFFSDRIRSLLAISRKQSLRLSRAFPHLRHRRYGSAWAEMKSHLQEKKDEEKLES